MNVGGGMEDDFGDFGDFGMDPFNPDINGLKSEQSAYGNVVQ